MPRPTSKTQLIAESLKEYTALEQLLDPLTPEQMNRPGMLGEWSVKDTLAHLLEWQRMVLGWYAAGLRGDTPAVPAEGYTWAQTPALNQSIYEKYRDRELVDVLAQFHASHQCILDLANSLPEDELFTPGRYPWMRKNTLAAYITSSAGSHYRWARTELHKGLKGR